MGPQELRFLGTAVPFTIAHETRRHEALTTGALQLIVNTHSFGIIPRKDSQLVGSRLGSGWLQKRCPPGGHVPGAAPLSLAS